MNHLPTRTGKYDNFDISWSRFFGEKLSSFFCEADKLWPGDGEFRVSIIDFAESFIEGESSCTSIIINEYFASPRLPKADIGGFLPLSKWYHSWASPFKSRESRWSHFFWLYLDKNGIVWATEYDTHKRTEDRLWYSCAMAFFQGRSFSNTRLPTVYCQCAFLSSALSLKTTFLLF